MILRVSDFAATVVVFTLLSSMSFAEARRPKAKVSAKARQAISTPVAKPVPKPRLISSTADSDSEETNALNASGTDFSNPGFIFSSGFGVHVLERPGLALQGQLLFSVGKKRQYYLGPDITYSLFSPGTSLTAALGGWYDLRIYNSPRLNVLLGVVTGPVFNAGLVGYHNVTYAFFVDLALVQEVDDLVSVKGQFRPGILGGTFSYVMSFQVVFRFM